MTLAKRDRCLYAPRCMDASDLRIALVSGNYNYTRDGANQALNRLMGHVLAQGAAVRVYSPTVAHPAFEPTGDLVSLPSIGIPTREEFRFPLGLPGAVRADLEAFRPNLVHIASPDASAHRAVSWARRRMIPVLASVHTRFETYPRYYGMALLEPAVEAVLRRLYRRCDALVAPSESMIATLRQQRMHHDISLWSRGVDREVFRSEKRDMEWRRSLGIGDEEVAVTFLGRLVMEKGLDIFADTMAELRRRKVPHRVLVIGDGPARGWFEKALPEGVFAGFQTGNDLGRALASGDVFFNPSVTETFGNVTLEAMASGLPVVAAGATGSTSLVAHEVTGTLVSHGEPSAYADAIATYCCNAELRHTHGAAGETRSRDFSWKTINQAVVEVYLRLVEAHRADS